MRRLLLLLVALSLAACAGAWWWWQSALYQPGDHAATTIVVNRGQSAVSILNQLAERSLLPSPIAARLYLEIAGRGRSPQFGHYSIPAGSRPVDLLEQLLSGEVETFAVTLIEGLNADESFEVLVAAGIGTTADWQRMVADTSTIQSLSPNARSLEGYLFPDTYRFAVGVPAQAVCQHLVDRFRRVWSDETASKGTLEMSVEEIVTLASLVEGETSVDLERAMIAGVYANRLRRGMLLQCDPTVVYGLKKQGLWTGRLLREHWKIDDSYNTYVHPGLPPGPINNPGRASLAAALAPAEHKFLYFVAKPGGGHTFSRTLAEHNRAVWRLKRSRR